MINKRKNRCNQAGFTLVELMVTVVLAFIVTAAFVASSVVQQRAQTAQSQVTVMQQNLRAAMEMMSSEFKMAAYDLKNSDEYNIVTATNTMFHFDADLCEDGEEPNAPGVACGPESPPLYIGEDFIESYQYQLADTDGDGLAMELQRTAGGPAVAENIEEIDFVYILANGNRVLDVPGGQLANVRAVQVTILARAENPDFNYTNNEFYDRGSGLQWQGGGDNFRRRLLSKTIELRNMAMTSPGI